MPRITESCLRQILEASDIISIAESYGMKLRRVGSSFTALCPFHKEKTPSFNLNPQKQFFKCFGCGVAGDVIKFVQQLERCEFMEAVSQLAQRAGITLEYEGGNFPPGGQPAPRADAKKPLLWANQVAFAYFRRSFNDDACGGKLARDYLLGRGFTPDTINAWGLGWAPDSWDGLIQFCTAEVRKRSDNPEKVEKALKFGVEAGIFRYNEEKDRTYDAFRGRVMFTIFDNQNRPIAFGGRVFEEKPDNGGKYLNTSETPLFEKRKTLFGLNYAAREIGATKEAIVVEGYVDTIMCHQYGIRNVVATLGTALTAEHVRLLKRYIGPEGRVVALFDADAAGRKATERAIEIFMEEDVPLAVLQGLEVKDAGEFLPKFGAEKFREFLGTAKDCFTYVLENRLGRNFGDDLAGKTAAVMAVMNVVNLCPNAIRRQMMRQQVAKIANVNEALLPAYTEPAGRNFRRDGERVNRPENAPDAAGRDNLGEMPILEPERKCRRKCEHSLLRYMQADQNWCAHIADVFPPDEWHFADFSAVAAMFRDAWQNSRQPDLSVMLAQTADDAVREVLIGLMATSDEPQPSDEELQSLLGRLDTAETAGRKPNWEAQLTRAELNGDAEMTGEALKNLVDLHRQMRHLDKK